MLTVFEQNIKIKIYKNTLQLLTILLPCFHNHNVMLQQTVVHKYIKNS